MFGPLSQLEYIILSLHLQKITKWLDIHAIFMVEFFFLSPFLCQVWSILFWFLLGRVFYSFYEVELGYFPHLYCLFFHISSVYFPAFFQWCRIYLLQHKFGCLVVTKTRINLNEEGFQVVFSCFLFLIFQLIEGKKSELKWQWIIN